jgi:alanyl-tRNA synthetase
MKEVDPRMHSAEHLLAGTLVKMFGTGRPFTTHLEKRKSKADFRFHRSLTEEEVREVERRVNEAIASDLRVREEFLPRDVAEGVYDLRRLPDAAGETVRVIHIGEYDACPCSGTHVSSSREIGAFRIVSTSFENDALRVRFVLQEPLA